MKTYNIKRIPNQGVIVTVTSKKGPYFLTPKHSQLLKNHSPDGFEYGYTGSGPSQLALALLADCCGDQTALKYYQTFKTDFVTGASGDKFDIFEKEIKEWVEDFSSWLKRNG